MLSLYGNEAYYKYCVSLSCAFIVSFIMTIISNGTQIQVKQPVHSISVNKNRVVFTDAQGVKSAQLSTVTERRDFINMLVNS